MYRPQFPYATPPKCEDQRCVYSYDQTNTPVLTGTLAAGSDKSRIPLLLDRDADFFLRGISTTDVGGNPLGALLTLRLEDPSGNPLSDSENSLQITNYQITALYSATDGAGIVALDSDEWGVFCQQGSRLYLYLYNAGVGTFDLTNLVVNLHGIKRYTGDSCK